MSATGVIDVDRVDIAPVKIGGLTQLERQALTLKDAGYSPILICAPEKDHAKVRELITSSIRLREVPFKLSAPLQSLPTSTPQAKLSVSKLYWPADVKAARIEAWTELQSPSDAKAAEKVLYQSLIKQTDGPISKKLNRPLSLAVTKLLVPFRIKPSTMTSFCIVLTLFAAWLALSPDWWKVALAGVLFHLASALDGCDGEIARLTFTASPLGAWYDTIGDNFRYGVFFCCLGWNAYQASGWSGYPWAIGIFAATLTTFISLNSWHLLRSKAPGTFLVVSAKVSEDSKKANSIIDRVVLYLKPLVKLDVQAFAAMVLCIIGLQSLMFWFALIGILVMTLLSARALKR